MENIIYRELNFFAGTHRFWKAENTRRWNTTHRGLQLRKPKKTANIIVKFWRNIYICERSLSKCVKKNLTRRRIEKIGVLIFLTESSASKIYLVVSSQVMNLEFLIMILGPRDKVISPRVSTSKIKSAYLFFDKRRIIQEEFVPPGQTMN